MLMRIADTSFPVFLIYDIILTSTDEMSHFWKRKPSPATVLYFMNRYIPVFGLIPLIIKCFAAPVDEVSNPYPLFVDIKIYKQRYLQRRVQKPINDLC